MAVKCLKKLKGIERSQIIVFDNGSSNEAFEVLQEKYRDEHNVAVGCSACNLGFSEGNNAAYRFALTIHHDYDYVVCMNSDVMIHQKGFLDLLEDYAKQDEYAILGPDAFNSQRRFHESPQHLALPSTKTLSAAIKECEDNIRNKELVAQLQKQSDAKAIIASHLPSFFVFLYRTLWVFPRRALQGIKAECDYRKTYTDPLLAGCCIVFFKKYLKNEKVLFEPDTFLYGEEMLLHLKCKTKGYKMIYDPKLKIEHKEAISTKADSKSYVEYVEKRNALQRKALVKVQQCMANNPWIK